MTGLAWAGLSAGAGGAVAASYAGVRAIRYASRNVDCAWFGFPVRRGTSARMSVALTFDDGPSESTPELLALLDKHDVPATFFQCGANVTRLPHVARQVAAASHEIGNHTYSHPSLCYKSGRFIHRELAKAQATIEDTISRPVVFFRPPYGLRWVGLPRVQRQLGLTSVLWTTTGFDWIAPEQEIVNRVNGGVVNGAIICLHDGRGLDARPDISATIGAVARLIPQLRDRGFQFETLHQITRITGESPSV
jgi:peptidoglycan/xylan/chitin deacetylase (PgdA/CDA1 family)